VNRGSLVVIETHPVLHHASMYRVLQAEFGISATVIYGSDFSVARPQDDESGATLAWDADLISGYAAIFLSRVADGGARTNVGVTTRGLRATLRAAAPNAVMLVGHSLSFHRRAFLTAYRAGYPILYRGETTDHGHRSNGLKDWARDKALRWFYQRCDRLLYVGQRSHEHFQRLGCPENKLMFSPYGVDTTPFQCDERSRERLRGPTRAALKIGSDKSVILFSGNLSKHQGPDLLLRAVKQLPAGGHDRIVVLFLGSGDFQSELQVLAQQPPAVITHFLGFQNRNELSKYYHAADLLALPSVQQEDWGAVVNVALHHGLPCVVSTMVGCAADLIESGVTGEVFETGSERDLATAIEKLLPLVEQPATRAACRAKMSGHTTEKGAQGVAEAFSSTIIGAKQSAAHCS